MRQARLIRLATPNPILGRGTFSAQNSKFAIKRTQLNNYNCISFLSAQYNPRRRQRSERKEIEMRSRSKLTITELGLVIRSFAWIAKPL